METIIIMPLKTKSAKRALLFLNIAGIVSVRLPPLNTSSGIARDFTVCPEEWPDAMRQRHECPRCASHALDYQYGSFPKLGDPI